MFIHLSVNATRTNRATWGDTQFAEGLARAIRAHPGCDSGLLFRGEAPPPVAGPAVLLRIIGPHLEEPAPGLPNILWMISPPNLAHVAMLGRYQAVLSASQAVADRMARMGLAATYLPQATETDHFHPDRRPAGATEIPLVFVGGYAPRADRRIVLNAVRAGFEPQIWGPGWKGIVPDHLWRGERLDYAGLAATYASARVVLNSHMTNMATLGFMSNRSYDALASGALVLSDPVQGFAAPDLPEIRQLRDGEDLAPTLRAMLDAPPLTHAARIALHDRLTADHGFAARAQVILALARRLLSEGNAAEASFVPGRRSDTAADTVAPRLTDPAASAETIRAGMRAAAQEIRSICRYLEQPDAPPLPAPEPSPQQGVIHAMMADLRRVQQIATQGTAAANAAMLDRLAARARRITETLQAEGTPGDLQTPPGQEDQVLSRIMRNEPLWSHAPEGFQHDDGKISLPLWPRQKPPDPAPELGVFLHLYYDDLAPTFAARLQHIETPARIYVSTDTDAKADRIRAALPMAEVRVLENRGRDIWPRLYGFGDAHDRHEVVLHLHGKKSPHSGKLDEWLSHILDCLAGSPAEVSRILSFFTSIPRLGLVVPIPFRTVLRAAHWAANKDIAREVAFRMGMTTPLPSDNALRFPVGSMFWARTAAIRPLLDLALRPAHFPPEAGQIDGTLAHAIERMLGVTCMAGVYHILPVSGAGTRLHVKHQKRFRTNGALRDALDSGAFDA